jgi:predicted nucleic acid-binding protein
MTSVFIEASALFRAYTLEPGSDVMDIIFLAMETHRIKGLISQFSVPEIIRGIIKRKNLQELADSEAQKIIDSILLDINTRVLNDELQILLLKEEYLSEVNLLIRSSNFFVIDAVQLVTASHADPAFFLHADNHFKGRETGEKIITIDIRKPDAKEVVKKVI